MFASLFLAGFECATGVNSRREWIDQVRATGHDRHVDEDYALVRAAGMRAAREAVRWPLVDRGGGRYDFSSVEPALRAARRHGVECVLDLFHFGYPRDVDLFDDGLPERFAEYCRAAARFVRPYVAEDCAFTPINEPSYFSWAGGEAGLFAPHAVGRGWELKVRLMRAAIAGIDAIRTVLPRARVVNVDPICRVVAPVDRPDLEPEAEAFNRDAVFQGWDMLAGRLLPELGGSARHLGTIGANYYWTNQWELGSAGVPLAPDDARRVSLRELVTTVWRRYGTDVVISETGHVGEMRAAWLRELACEVAALLEAGVPLGGVCLYPILGMPEWHEPEVWARMGLWDLESRDGRLHRVRHEPMFEALDEARSGLEHLRRANRPRAAVAS